MARRKRDQGDGSNQPINDTEKKRTHKDYFFEDHRKDGSIMPIGLVLHYPSEVPAVTEYLERHRDVLGIKGEIKVCQKTYS